MKNLAGDKDCDETIREELRRCRVPAVYTPSESRGEVPSWLTGRLGAFTFSRRWYYWSAEGEVPVSVAWELYEDPVGKSDVRVAGHCGCPPPEAPWAKKDSHGDDVIRNYHIDTEVGLRLFVDTLRKHGLHRPRPPGNWPACAMCERHFASLDKGFCSDPECIKGRELLARMKAPSNVLGSQGGETG